MRFTRFSPFEKSGAAPTQVDASVRKERNAFPFQKHSANRREIAARNRSVRHHDTVPGQMIRACAHREPDKPRAARVSDRFCNIAVAQHLSVRDRRNDRVHTLKKRICHFIIPMRFSARPQIRKPERRSVSICRSTGVRPQAARSRTPPLRRPPRRDRCRR